MAMVRDGFGQEFCESSRVRVFLVFRNKKKLKYNFLKVLCFFNNMKMCFFENSESSFSYFLCMAN